MTTQHNPNQFEQVAALVALLVALVACVFIACLTWWQAEEINRLRGDLQRANSVIEEYRQHQDNQTQAPEQQRGRLRNIGDQVAAFERQTLEAREEIENVRR